ncbi:uncharacterized protein LOC122043794 [Zingiber officinale]|uniref:uncharacterized protein LOC122043794 n=1 Tax=Zingiber officinale TaxID=94328 RepID=UPI001C4B00A1|nr:uncharacterized protein LOC122043794 [Zingiber officinale]
MVMMFIWQHIVCRFGIPRRLVSDNRRQFAGQRLREWCEGYGIQQAFTSVAYLYSNSWVDELPSVLWVIHTTPKEGTGATPFHLVYGGEAVVPVEVGFESDWIQYYNEDNAERRLLELDLVEEVCAKATVRLMAY